MKGEDEGNPPSDEDLPDDAFYMLSQQPWENDIIFEATTQSVSGMSLTDEYNPPVATPTLFS